MTDPSNPIVLTLQFVDELLARPDVDRVGRARLVGRVAHHTVRAEMAPTQAESLAHLDCAEVVVGGLRTLRERFGDTSTDSVRRMQRHVDETREACDRKWRRAVA